MELDKDLQARQEARALCRRAEEAQRKLGAMDQRQLDAIVEAVAAAFSARAEELARLAVQETGFGNVEDKTVKNRFASETVAAAVRHMKCIGHLKGKTGGAVWEIGVPVGVIAGIVPSTNPTSTVCYKAIIALKSGNTIVFSPHPKALQCTLRAAEIVEQAARSAGAPEGAVSCLRIPSMAGCRELMEAPEVKLILATGGPAMVKAAYSSGKPAIGVGAGNGPAYIHRSADVARALEDILRSKTFDNGTVCASEQSIVVERGMAEQVERTARTMGFHFMSAAEAEALGSRLFQPGGSLDPKVVGKRATELAKIAGFSVAADTKILVAREDGVGKNRPYSMEKLCPVLAFYVMEDEDAVLRRTLEVLRHEGSGHTFVLHAREEAVVRRFAEHVPVSRFLVNTPAALGGIGASTGLFPALTLGCGAVGGSSSSNNISPMDLINIRRVAWGTGESRKAEAAGPDPDLVEVLTERILKRLEGKTL